MTLLLVANALLALGSILGFLALDRHFTTGPPTGWKAMRLAAVFAVVPAQVCLAAAWAATGQQRWMRRVMGSAGVIPAIGLLVVITDGWTNYVWDFGRFLIQSVVLWLIAFAVFRPLSAMLGCEFGDQRSSGVRGQFSLLDIVEWTVAVALPLALVQVLDPLGKVYAMRSFILVLVLAPCILLLTTGGLSRSGVVATSSLAVLLMLSVTTMLYLLYYYGIAQQSWLPVLLAGLALGGTATAAINLIALHLLGYRLQRRPAGTMCAQSTGLRATA